MICKKCQIYVHINQASERETRILSMSLMAIALPHMWSDIAHKSGKRRESLKIFYWHLFGKNYTLNLFYSIFINASYKYLLNISYLSDSVPGNHSSMCKESFWIWISDEPQRLNTYVFFLRDGEYLSISHRKTLGFLILN